MRIRTIKPEFFKHEDLFDLECESGLPIRTAFIGLWCVADREGRFKWKPRMLKAEVLPYDNCDFSRVLDALATRGFVVKYTSQGEDYGWIKSFKRHQIINHRERASELPEPLEIVDVEEEPTRAPRVPHASTTRHGHASGEGKGREGKGYTPIAPKGAVEGDPEIPETDEPEPDEGSPGDTDPAPVENLSGTSAKNKTPRGLDPLHERLVLIFQKSLRTGKRDAAELRAWRRVKGDIDEAGVALVERFYRLPKAADCDQTWKRKTALAQLLNQWHEQVGLAEAYFAKGPNGRPWSPRKTVDPNAHPAASRLITPIDEEEFYGTWIPRD